MASSIDVDKEETVTAREAVNASSYVSFHNAQMFQDGFSFSGNERNKTWLNGGDAFVDLSDVSGADTPNDSRAVLAHDFDDDGDVDLFVHSIQRERHALYRNDALRPGKDAGFLKLKLRATTTQHEAIGAIVTVQGPAGPVAQVLARGAGFVSGQADELVFGLGAAPKAAVEVLWPGGARESFGELAAGARALLVEGAGEPQAYGARARPLPDPPPTGLALDEGDLLPALAVVDAAGTPATLDPVALAGGKNLLVVFWASYCDPCVKEIPDLEGLHAGGEQRVVAVSLDVPDAIPAAVRRLERGGATYPAFYLPDERAAVPDGATALRDVVDLERMPVPTTLVLSPEGRVETILRGPLKAEGAGG